MDPRRQHAAIRLGHCALLALARSTTRTSSQPRWRGKKVGASFFGCHVHVIRRFIFCYSNSYRRGWRGTFPRYHPPTPPKARVARWRSAHVALSALLAAGEGPLGPAQKEVLIELYKSMNRASWALWAVHLGGQTAPNCIRLGVTTSWDLESPWSDPCVNNGSVFGQPVWGRLHRPCVPALDAPHAHEQDCLVPIRGIT